MTAEPEIRVLLIEDDPTDALLTEDTLGMGRFQVQRSERLEQGLQRMETSPFDVVLLDLGLPDSQGLDTLRVFRAHFPAVAVIVLTGRDDEELAVEALQSGAQDYLVKGQIDYRPLQRAVRYAVERSKAEEHLRREQERFRLLVEAVHDHAIFMLDTDGRVQTWNSGARVVYGYADQDIVGAHVSKFYLAEDVQKNVPHEELTEARQAGECQRQGWRLRQDGQHFWTDCSTTALHDQAGRVVGFVKIARDLTEKRRSDLLLRAVLDNAFDAIVSIDEQGTIEIFNASAERIFGYRAHEIIGRNISLMMPEPHRAEHDDYLARYLASGDSRVIGNTREVEGARKDDSRVPLQITVTEFQLDGDRQRHFIGNLIDISRRKQAEESQARLTEVLEATPDLVALADAQGRLFFVNQAGRKLVGLGSSDDLAHLDVAQFAPAWVADKVRTEGLPHAMEQGAWMGETVLRTRDGQEIPVSQVIVAHRNPSGDLRFLSTIIRDLTEQKKLEEQFRQSQKMEAVGLLAGGVAHDFNNLLTIVIGYCDLLLDSMEAGLPQHNQVEAVRQAAERGSALTQQLLAFSRKSVLEPKVLDLNHVVRQTESFLRRVIGEDIELALSLTPDVRKVKVDPGQLWQVLMNLAVNARDAMPRGGKLTLETRDFHLDEDYARTRDEVTPGHYVALSVSDTGCGMSPDVRKQVFDPFFTTKNLEKGTGLGLAVVHGIVKQSGGHVEVYSELGIGTTFKVYLPSADTPAAEIPQAEAEEIEAPGDEVVLLVEDDEGLRRLAHLILESYGYQVLVAASGAEAIALATDHGHLDLLFSDVVMPGQSGPELCKALRQQFPDLKVLFSSGYTDDTVLRHGILHEEVAFIQKPYSPTSLAKKIRQVLGNDH